LLCDWEVETEEEGLSIAEAVIGKALENEQVSDAVIAMNETQAAELLSIREHMSAGQKFLGGSVKHDITVPIDKIPDFFKLADAAMQRVVPGCRPVGFGHFGDGNIHYNIAQPERADKAAYLKNWDALSQPVFDIVDQLGGSISAEHGIGIMKRDDLAERASPVKMKLLRAVKTALDPEGIMNPRVMV
jgi:FAD/FMN-containing dehydrogenase